MQEADSPPIKQKPQGMKENLQGCSKLVKRLYRNTSLNRINSNLSLLSSVPFRQTEISPLNKSNANQLVASISLKKLRKSNISQRSLEISNGKIIITQHHEPSQFRNHQLLPKKNMFKKLQKLDVNPLNKILPDDLIDFPIENQSISDLKPFKKASQFSKSTKHNKGSSILENKYENLLPEDFIQLLKEDKCITNQFCYLKKMEHPYDLKIIQPDSNFPKNNNQLGKGKHHNSTIYPDEYITISSRGITYFGKEQSRIVPLEEWKKEADYFKKIMKLNFFRNYKIIKNFGNWKKYIRKSSMKSIVEKLKDQLVVNDRFLRASLLETRNMCFLMETDVSYCKLDECQNVMNFKEFKESQEAFIQNQFQRKITQIQEDIKSILINNMSASMKEFKEENKISSGMEGKGMPLLIGDQKNLDMPYTKQATLRTQQEKFKKFTKLIDLLITHSKVNMMNESTEILAKKINEENDSYERQVIDTRYKHTYKGKQYLQCFMNLEQNQQIYCLQPPQDEIGNLFEDVINRSVVKLCRNHRKISQDVDILSIIYDNSDQFPKESDSSILKVIMTSDDRQQRMVGKIMKEIAVSYRFIEQYAKKYQNLVDIYFSNIKKLESIDNFNARDHQTIKVYMESWKTQLQKINQITQDHESALFLLNLRDFKNKAMNMTMNCINKTKKIIPKIFQHSVYELTTTLTNALAQMQNKPIGIQSYIVFQNNKNIINNDLEEYSDRMLQINCLWILMKNISSANMDSSNMKKQERQIRELQAILNNMRRKIEEADMNNKIYETRAQQEVKQMVPKSKSRIVELYNKITALARQEKDTASMVSFIERKSEELKSIRSQMNDIRVYQKFLNLQEYSGEDIDNFTQFFNVFQQIWETKNTFEIFWEKKIMEKPWGTININDINHRFQEFITIMLALDKSAKQFKKDDFPYQLSSHDIKSLNFVIEEIQKQRPLVETIECLNDKFLTDKEWKQIKHNLESRNQHELMNVLEKDRHQTSTKLLFSSSIVNELKFFRTIVYKAKKQNDVINKLQTIKSFWKTQINVCRNLLQNFQDTYNNLVTELQDNLILVNSIYEDPNERQRIKRQKEMLERLRQILLLWNDHEKHTNYFDPIYCHLDWKGTKEGKIYSSAQQNWKKTIKQYKDTQLSKLAINDKLTNILQQNNELFQTLYENAFNHLNTKRFLYPRLFFLSNKEMIKLYSQHKDFKTLNKFINNNEGNGKIFRHLKEISINQDEQIPYEVKNTDGQLLGLKIGRVNCYQVQQLFKVLQQSIKSSVKGSLKACYQAFDTQTFNRVTWMTQYPLQSILYIDKVYFTKIIQYDYLCPNGDDLTRLHAFHLSQIDNIRNVITESDNELMHKKLSIILTQSLSIRDTILYLIHNKVETLESFEWIKQIRHYYNLEQAFIDYMGLSILYGNEFVSLFDNPLLIHNLHEKYLIEFTHTIINSLTCPISTKSYCYQFSTYNAKNYAELQLTNQDDSKCLENFIIGTWLTGTITDIKMENQFGANCLKTITKLMREVQVALSHKEPYLRGSKSLLIQRQSAFVLIPPQNNKIQFNKLRFDYRELKSCEVDLSHFLSLLFQLHNITSRRQYVDKFSRKIKYIEQAYSKTIFQRNELKKIIEESILQSQGTQYLQELIKDKCISLVHNKLADDKMIRFIVGLLNDEAPEGSLLKKLLKKMTNKLISEKHAHENIIKEITDKFKTKTVCVISGHHSLSKQLIVNGIYKEYNNDQKYYLNIGEENLHSFFGFYENNCHWNGSYLIKMIKKIKKTGCIVIKAKINKLLFDLIRNIENNKLYLHNGQKIEIPKNVKFVINANNDYFDFEQLPCTLIDGDQFNLSSEEIFDYVLRSQIKEQILSEHEEGYTSLCNIFLNNYEKILSNMKLIGFKNQYTQGQLIMIRFAKIMNSAFSRDGDKCCLRNVKMLQKMYFWAIFWSIGSGIPKSNSLRYEKILFETVKADMDRSQNLTQTHLIISERMQTICKAIKQDFVLENKQHIIKVTKEMEAKAQFIHLLTQHNTTMMLIGNKGAGKTTFLQYIQYKFNQHKTNPYSFYTLNMHKGMNLPQLIGHLMLRSFIRVKTVERQSSFYLSPLNGNKLLILIDNFNTINRDNSQMVEFFDTVFEKGYYFDTTKNTKIILQNICFICSENSSYQPIDWPFLLTNCVPIYINEVDLKEIVDEYKITSTQPQKQELHQKLNHVLESTVCIHNFVVNLLQTGSSIYKYHLSNAKAISIVVEMLEQINSIKDVIELISKWKYLCVQKYVHSGLILEKQQCQSINNELNNLINLMLKNSDQVGNIFESQKKLYQQLSNEFKMLRMANLQNYYLYLMYLIQSPSPKHILKGYERIHHRSKEKILTKICQRFDKELIVLNNIIQLVPHQSKVIYVPANSSIQLILACLLYICTNAVTDSFIIDLPPNQTLFKLIAQYPVIPDHIEIYREDCHLSHERGCDLSYIQFINSIESRQLPSKVNKEQLMMEISQNIEEVEGYLFGKIKKRLAVLERVTGNFKDLRKIIEYSGEQIERKRQKIQQLNDEQEKMLKEKNVFFNKLTELKMQENTNPQEKQTINKMISSLDTELQKVKRKKNTYMQEKTKQTQTKDDNLTIETLFTNIIKEYTHNHKLCQQINQKKHQLVLCTLFLILHYKTKQNYLLQLAQQIGQKIGYKLSAIYGCLFNIQINSVKESAVILWMLYDQKVTFITQDKDELIQYLIEKFPQLKHCLSEYDVSQYGGKIPIITHHQLTQSMPLASVIRSPSCCTGNEVLYEHQVNHDEEFHQKLFERIDVGRHNQITFTLKDMRRFEHQRSLIDNKLKLKLESKDDLFRQKNDALQVKQFYESANSMNQRVKSCRQKISTIQQQKQSENGEIYRYAAMLYQYLSLVKRLHPYAQISDNVYLTIIQRSILQQKQRSQSQISQSQEKPQETPFSIQNVKNKIIQDCYKWVCLMLKDEHALLSYFLLSCFVQRSNEQITSLQIEVLLEIIERKQDRLSELIKLSPEEQLQQSTDEFCKVLCALVLNNENKYHLMLNYSEKVLKYDFRSNIILNKTDVIEQLIGLTSHQKHQQIVVGIGSQLFNSLKVVDREISRIKNQQEIILTFSEGQHYTSAIDGIQKLPANQQVWVVLVNWTSPNINSFINYVETKTSTTSVKVFILFDEENKYLERKKDLKIGSFVQVGLNYKEQSVSYFLQKLLSKFIHKNGNVDAAKLLKMVFFDRVNLVMKQLINHKQLRLNPYNYRFMEMMFKKFPKIDLNSLVSFFMEFIYENGQKIFPRQAKKHLKIQKIIDTYEDSVPVETYTLINETYEEIRKKIQNQEGIKTMASHILPKGQAQKINIDILYQFQTTSQKPSVNEQIPQETININTWLLEVEQILNKMPVLTKQDKNVKSVTPHFYRNVFRQQKAKLERIYRRKAFQIRKIKKILNSNRTISTSSLSLIKHTLCNENSFLTQMLDIEQSIQTLDSLIERKDHEKYISLKLIDNPKQFIYIYMYQLNAGNFDWFGQEIVCRCFSDKQKQIFLQTQQKKQYLCLSNLYVEGGRFDSHKAIIENLVDECHGQMEKLNNNIFIYFKKGQLVQPNLRQFMLSERNRDIINVHVMAKVKEPSIWDKIIFICQHE